MSDARHTEPARDREEPSVLCRARRMAAATLLAALLVATTGCSSTHLAPISAVGASFQPLPDELELWHEAWDQEQALVEQYGSYPDSGLHDYLQDVADRLEPAGMAATPEVRFRVLVLDHPGVRAHALPYGTLVVHSGLLAQVDNEDQLAALLAHEMTHVEHRHRVRHERAKQNQELTVGLLTMTSAILLEVEAWEAWAEGDWQEEAALEAAGELVWEIGEATAEQTSAKGYGDELEQEADRGAVEKLRRAGYDPWQAVALYRHLLELGSGDYEDALGNHDGFEHRVGLLAGEVSRSTVQVVQPPVLEAQQFADVLRDVLLDDVVFQLELGQLDRAEAQIDKALARLRSDGEAHRLRAQLLVARSTEDPSEAPDLRRAARGELREAIRLEPGLAWAHRDLGRLALSEDDHATACTALRHYLELSAGPDPGAQSLLDQLRADGHCTGRAVQRVGVS